MEQIVDQTKQQSREEVAGIGEWQSKLAELLKFNQKKVGDAFLFASKRRDVSAQALQIGFTAVEALRENSRLIITHFKDHENRESYAKDLYERLVIK